MPYCSQDNVRILIETPLSDSEISSLIEESDTEIDRRVGSQPASDPLVRRLSSLMTAKIIRSSYPESVSVGEYQESERSTLANWSDEIERIIRVLKKPKLSASPYSSIDEEERFPEE